MKEGLPAFLKDDPAVIVATQVERLYADIPVFRSLVSLRKGNHRTGAVRLNFNIINLNFPSCRATKEVPLMHLPFLDSHFLILAVGMIASCVGLQVSLFPSTAPIFNKISYKSFCSSYDLISKITPATALSLFCYCIFVRLTR